MPRTKTADQRLLNGLFRLATEEYLPEPHRISRIAQTTALGDDAESLTDRFWREAERDVIDMAQLKHFPPNNDAILLARAVATASYFGFAIRRAAEADGRPVTAQAWNLLVSALTLLALRYDTPEGRTTLAATVDQISAEVAAL